MKPKRKSKFKSKGINNTKKMKGGAFLSGAALTKLGAMQTAASGTSGTSGKSGSGTSGASGSGTLSLKDLSEMTFTKFVNLSMQAILKIASSITTLPIRNVDELIPPELCKKFANPFACSQSVLQYLFIGTKPDNKKVIPDSDKNDCISYDEDGNKIVNCKQKGGTITRKKTKYNYSNLYQYGGGMIIGCENRNNESNINNSKKN